MTYDPTKDTILGFDTAFSIDGTVYGGVVDVTPPSPQVSDIDVSHIKSPGRAKQFRSGWSEGGEVSLTLQLSVETEAIIALQGVSKGTCNATTGEAESDGFLVTLSSGATWRCAGYIKQISTPIERDGIVTLKITIKVSGKPKFTAA